MGRQQGTLQAAAKAKGDVQQDGTDQRAKGRGDAARERPRDYGVGRVQLRTVFERLKQCYI